MELKFIGEAGHAGTVPMGLRKDALCCAAEFIIETEKYAKAHRTDLVATTGKLDIPYSSTNVIAGEVVCSLDVRHENAAILESSANDIRLIAESVGKNRNIVSEWKPVQNTDPVMCDPEMNRLLALSIQEAGFPAIELVSGAGHDAVAVSAVGPVCMLFVRCFKGISHNPLEDVAFKDIRASLMIAENFIRHLIKKHSR